MVPGQVIVLPVGSGASGSRVLALKVRKRQAFGAVHTALGAADVPLDTLDRAGTNSVWVDLRHDGVPPAMEPKPGPGLAPRGATDAGGKDCGGGGDRGGGARVQLSIWFHYPSAYTE
eukprot:g1438.t1